MERPYLPLKHIIMILLANHGPKKESQVEPKTIKQIMTRTIQNSDTFNKLL